MKKLHLTASLVALGWLGLGSLLLVAPAQGCSQPRPDCRAARGDFAVKYTLVSGNCAAPLTAGFVGLQSYNPRAASCSSPETCKPDYEIISLSIQQDVLGNLLINSQDFSDPSVPVDYVDHVNKPYGSGLFSSIEPDDDNICNVPSFSPAEQNIVEIVDPADPATIIQPASDVKNDWSNLKVFVTAGAPGTIFTVDLSYSETIDGVSCAATYKVKGVWPPVDCQNYDPETGDPLGTANEGLCHVDPTTAPPGSVVINPDLDVVCDPDIFYCVPNTVLPGL